MYETLFGCTTALNCLLYIANYGEGHTRGIARTFSSSPSSVLDQLMKLEQDGILVSRFIGNIRRFTFNNRLAIRKELLVLLEKILSLQDEETTQKYYRQRRRPVNSTRRSSVRKKRLAAFTRDSGVCVICSTYGEDWELNHTIPLSEGGTDELSNMRTLCIDCHKIQTKELNDRLRLLSNGAVHD